MEFIKFEKKHILGFKEIDDQHKKIYTTLNEIYKIKNAEKKTIVETFNSLLNQLKKHFETEETLMKENKVVEFISHKLEHERALNKYLEYFDDYKSNVSNLDEEILLSLKNWLNSHFEKKDIKLKYLINKN